MFRALDRWLLPYLLRDRRRPQLSATHPVHVFVAVCDHFEPFHHTDKTGALKALSDWHEAWPVMVEKHRDSSARGPRHTFFYPIEQYDKDVIESLAALCERTGSEVEVHLHHANDTAETLTEQLHTGLAHLAEHGLLSRRPDGAPAYGFIHGNWALDHSHPEGKHCGVPNELDILQQTGCYADFTLPSAPDPAQTRIINSIYYAKEDGKPASHNFGTRAKALNESDAKAMEDALLLVQGPLGFNWRWRKWGLLPRLENGDLTGENPPTLLRFQLWMKLCPMIEAGPPWIFVKLHTHSGIPRNYRHLLGAAGEKFHTQLARHALETPGLHYHYVTAREMVNLIHAAESGVVGEPLSYLDYRLQAPPRITQSVASQG